MLGEDLLVVSSQFQDFGLFMHNFTKLLLSFVSEDEDSLGTSAAAEEAFLVWRLLLPFLLLLFS